MTFPRRRSRRRGWSRLRPVVIAAFAPFCAVCASLHASVAQAALTPSEMEKEVLRISRHLKPIPDSDWESIAGAQAEQIYAVVHGDTLYDISKRLFGDPKYWPKIWALNNNSILNPHLIRPGVKIAFRAGTGTDVPGVTLVDAGGNDSGSLSELDPEPRSAESGKRARGKRRSAEWQRLPAQRWERGSIRIIEIPPEDDMGFKGNLLAHDRQELTFQQRTIVTSVPVYPLGEITTSTTIGLYPYLLETVFVRSDIPLEVGQTYAITSSAESLLSPQGDSSPRAPGYAYPYLGKVKITGQKDEIYRGIILSSQDSIERGNVIIKLPKEIGALTPVPTEKPIEAALIPSRLTAFGMVAERDTVYINRGSADGVKPGNVFRIFQRQDLVNGLPIALGSIAHFGEAMVIQTSEQYSAAIVTRSTMPIESYEIAISRTSKDDLSDLPSLKPTGDGNELDLFNQNDRLKPHEKRELDQLENWKSNPDPNALPSQTSAQTPATTPATAPLETPVPTAPPPETSSIPEPSGNSAPSLPEPPSPSTESIPPASSLPPPPSDMLTPPSGAMDSAAELPPPPPF